MLHNFCQGRLEFNTGCICSGFVSKKKSSRFVEVEYFNDFVTERNIKGFVSTGI